MKPSSMLATGCLLLAITTAYSIPVSPSSYDTPNGYTGSYEYWDESYNGSGNTAVSGASLTGGTGDLTDDVIATDNWTITEAPAGPGPYVGWNIDPTIVFHFNSVRPLTQVTLYLDDSNGSGGVSAPDSVSVSLDGGLAVNYVVPEPAGSEPFAFTIPIGPAQTVAITLVRKDIWVFLSEVDFEERQTAVPDTGATLSLLAIACTAVGGLRRRLR